MMVTHYSLISSQGYTEHTHSISKSLKKNGVPRVNPHRSRKNKQSPHRKDLDQPT